MTQFLPFPEARRVDLPKGGWLSVHEQPGAGQTLLLLHGFTDCAESFRLIEPYFSGFHLIMPDLRGHGQSFRSDVKDLSDFALDVEQMFEAMGLSEAVLIGHSMGALIALTLAERCRMDVRGMILISGSLIPASPILASIVDRFALLPSPLSPDHPFLDSWYDCSRPVARSFLDRLKNSCSGMRPIDWMSCLHLLTEADLRTTAQAIRVPSLVVAGGQDLIFSSNHRPVLQEYLRPLEELFLPDVGHNPHWEAPAEVACAILSFLSALDKSA